MSQSATHGENHRPYKVDTGPIPLDTLAVLGEQECWYRIPSWRVHFDHDALRLADIRLHRAIGSHGVWTLTEATTGLKMFSDLPHDQYIGDEGAMLAEFAAGQMLKLTPEMMQAAIAKGKETLSKRSPNPFAVSETAPKLRPHESAGATGVGTALDAAFALSAIGEWRKVEDEHMTPDAVQLSRKAWGKDPVTFWILHKNVFYEYTVKLPPMPKGAE